jgi:subfamily B ATP-binding cassette protein MsbA
MRRHTWALAATMLLGLLSSLAESVGLSLFVPLLQSLDERTGPSAANRVAAGFHFVFRWLPEHPSLRSIAGLILLLTICKGSLTYTHSALAARINAQLTHSLRTRVFSKLLVIPQKTLAEVGDGRVINLLATDTWHTSDAISSFLGLVINLCSIAVFSLVLIALSWKLTVVFALGVAMVSLLLRLVTLRAERWGKEGVDANAHLSEHMLDALEGLREVQMFGLQSHRQVLFDAVSARVRSIYLKLDLLHRATPPLSETLYMSLLLGLLVVGVAGLQSVPAIIVFLLVLYRLQPQIRQLDSGMLSLLSLTSSVEAVIRFLNDGFQTANFVPAGQPAPMRKNISFEHVCFSYGDDREFALRDVSFEIPHGKVTAVVGPSGSGKTTLISLLCRFYEPLSGSIRADGSPLTDLPAGEWREQIAWVSQDAHIFSATVAENIRYGNLAATDDEIHQAAVAADAASFIAEMPAGLETKVGSGGLQLSSGQVQRIALARAFVRRPAILILDEATNALDSLSEEAIRGYLRKMPHQSTVVIVSHRLSSVYHADQIVVLSNGSVSEYGEPRDLIVRPGFLARLRELQYVE